MTAAVAALVRHPVKAIGHEALEEVTLAADRTLPFDRHWAVAHAEATFAGDPAAWVPKMNFLRGVAGPELMAIRARLSADGGTVTLTHPVAGSITVTPGTDDDTALLAWLAPLWPAGRPPAARLVRAPGGALTDVPDPYISILSTTSNAALGQALGTELSIHRWRGNVWVAGWEPFAEFGLIGRHIRIGGAEVRIEARITRCKATTVNPETGRVDADTLGMLESRWGHQDFGVYGRVVAGGRVAVGDTVNVP